MNKMSTTQTSAALVVGFLSILLIGYLSLGTGEFMYVGAEENEAGIGLPLGSDAPEIHARDTLGNQTDLEALMGSRGLLLVFVRPIEWSDYGQAYLKKLQALYKNFQRLGINIAAISPDAPTVIREYIKETDLQFPLLSDQEARTVIGYHLQNKESDNNQGDSETLHPGTYLLNYRGKIVSKYFVENYRKFTDVKLIFNDARDLLWHASKDNKTAVK